MSYAMIMPCMVAKWPIKPYVLHISVAYCHGGKGVINILGHIWHSKTRLCHTLICFMCLPTNPLPGIIFLPLHAISVECHVYTIRLSTHGSYYKAILGVPVEAQHVSASGSLCSLIPLHQKDCMKCMTTQGREQHA